MDVEQVIKRFADLADLLDRNQTQLEAEACEERGRGREYAADHRKGLAGGMRIARTLLLVEITNIERKREVQNAPLIRQEPACNARGDGVEV